MQAIPGGVAFDECVREIFSRVFMKIMKIVIFIPIEPAPVESTSRMKFITKTRVEVIDHPNVDVHHTLAGSSQIDFFDGWPRGRVRTFWSGPAECAGPLGGI